MRRGKVLFLKLAVIVIGLIVLMVSSLWLPSFARELIVLHPNYSSFHYPILIGIYVTIIPFYLALYQAFQLLVLIDEGEAFSERAVKSLRHIMYGASSIGVIYVVGLIVPIQQMSSPSILFVGTTIAFAAFTIAFFAAVLQELLRRALEIKSENDLTV